MINTGESILQSEFQQFSKSNTFLNDNNWFCFQNFWVMIPKMYWIKQVIIILDEKDKEKVTETVNIDQFKSKFSELYYASLTELTSELDMESQQQQNQQTIKIIQDFLSIYMV